MFAMRFFAVCLLGLGSLCQAQTPSTIVNIVADSTAHNTLEALVTRAGLVSTLQGTGPFTLFAPTDAAFTALGTSTLVKKITADPLDAKWKPLLQDVLTYHVLSGKTMSTALPSTATKFDTVSKGSKLSIAGTAISNVDGAGSGKVTTADLSAGNGVVHVLDGVLLPPSTQRSVVTIATSNTAFTTLVSLLKAADLVTTLSTDAVDTAFTVFAPTNDAFAKIDKATLDCLGKTENKALLANLLKFHVVSGTVLSASLTNNMEITSIATGGNNKFKFMSTGTKLMASGESSITSVDILANNGVVHIIDTVLIPSNFKCPAPGMSAASTATISMVTVVLGALSALLAVF